MSPDREKQIKLIEDSSHVGFTGTRVGMTEPQATALAQFLAQIVESSEGAILHHGDCIGSDAQAHDIALALGMGIKIHPPSDEKLRAFCIGSENVAEPKPYLRRNVDIVQESTVTIGTPTEAHPQARGGTWWTLKYSSESGQPTFVILPSGEITEYKNL